MIDSSATIGMDNSHNNWELILRFVANIVQKLEIGSTKALVGVVVYSDYADNSFYLNSYYDKLQIIDAIDRIRYMGSSSNLVAGIEEMQFTQFTHGRGERSDAPNFAIIITDGGSSTDTRRILTAASAAKDQGIKILAVGITGNADEQMLMEMSSEPHIRDHTYWMVPNYLVLNDILNQVIEGTGATITPPSK